LKHTNILYKLFLSLLFILSLPTYADIVPSDPPFDLDPDTSKLYTINTAVVASDSNAVTGQYIVSWVYDVFLSSNKTISCSQHELDGSLIQRIDITPIVFADYSPSMSVKLSDEGSFYLAWSARNDTASVYAYDNQGTLLFSPFPYQSGDGNSWQNISIALTTSEFWLVGSTSLEGSTNQGFRYALDGTFVANITDDINDSSKYNCNANVAINQTGDLIVSWVEVNDIALKDDCIGSIVAQIFRESGTIIGEYIDVSNSRDDDDAFAGNPRSIADELGQFVITWDDGTIGLNTTFDTYAARVFPIGNGSALAAENVMSGLEPKISAGATGQDFVILSEDWSSGLCVNNLRFASQGDLDPEIDFTAGSCNNINDILLLNDDSMLFIYDEAIVAGDPSSNSKIVAQRYYKPSEIEIDDVSIIEGSSTGEGPLAVISVTLSKPHPTGEDITVNYYTQDITTSNITDYPYTTGTLTFSAGSTIEDILIEISPDTDYENSETFSVNLELAENAVIQVSQGIVTIINDDSSPLVTNDCDFINPTYCKEVDEPLDGEFNTLPITLSIDEAQDIDVTFNYSTEDVTATAGLDYIASSGSVEIPAGTTQANIFIKVLGDLEKEVTESFKINFSSSSQVNIENDSLEIGIIDEIDCLAVLSPTGQDIISDGGVFSFDIDVEDGCDWSIDLDFDPNGIGNSNGAWIQLTDPLSGTGNGDATVSFNVDSQAGLKVYSREGLINVTTSVPFDQTSTHTIIQAGDTTLCDYIPDTSEFNFDVNSGTGSFNVSVDDPCIWEVFSGTGEDSWVTITSPTEAITGDGTVEFSISDNAGDVNVLSPDRSTVLGGAFFDVTINQTGCTYSLTEYSVDISDESNDSVTTSVLAPDQNASPCTWSAVSSASWILVTEGNGGEGYGDVVMDVLLNSSVEPRVGTVQIGDQTFTVNQEGQPCVYDIDETSVTVCPDGRIDDLSVLATAGCGWSLDPDKSWLQVNSNPTGIGDEISEIQVMSNQSVVPRDSILYLFNDDMVTQKLKSYTQSGYLVYEDFDSNTLPDDFIVTPDGLWQVTDQDLNGNLLNSGTGFALDASETAYCSDCKVEGIVSLSTLSSSSQPNIGIVGWYQSDQSYVSLTMDEFANQWRLSLSDYGVATFVEVDGGELIPNQSYQLQISYDDQYIYGQVDGVQILQLEHNLLTSPTGYPGFMLNNAGGTMSLLTVTGNYADADLIFDGSFETPVFQSPSECSL
jgi:hypothetical protein